MASRVPVRPGSRLPRWIRGIAALELALVLPMLVLLLVLVGDFSRVFYSAITLTHAARAGAAYGAQSAVTGGDAVGIASAARAEAVNIGTVGVQSSLACACPGTGAVNCVSGSCGTYGPPQMSLSVTATQTFETLIRYPLVPHQLALSRTAIVRVQ